MKEKNTLLHNMSGPPHSVLKYSGLGDFASAENRNGAPARGVFGTPVRVALPAALAGQSAADILRHLGCDVPPDPEKTLAALIDARANRLALPDGCAVIPAADEHRLIWEDDALSVLAVLAKCSNSIWLRAKSPALNAALQRRQVTLLVPPRFAGFLKEQFK